MGGWYFLKSELKEEDFIYLTAYLFSARLSQLETQGLMDLEYLGAGKQRVGIKIFAL